MQQARNELTAPVAADDRYTRPGPAGRGIARARRRAPAYSLIDSFKPCPPVVAQLIRPMPSIMSRWRFARRQESDPRLGNVLGDDQA